jgi:hypothetical protein
MEFLMNMLRVLCFFLFLGFSQLGFSAGKPSRRDGVVFVQEYGFYATNFNSINSINAPDYVGALHVSSCHLLVIEDPDGAFALAHLTAAQLSHEEAHKALPNGLRAMLASFQTNGGRIDKARFSIYGGGFDEAKRIKKRNFLKKTLSILLENCEIEFNEPEDSKLRRPSNCTRKFMFSPGFRGQNLKVQWVHEFTFIGAGEDSNIYSSDLNSQSAQGKFLDLIFEALDPVQLALKKQLEEAHKQYFQKPELQESVLTSKEVDRSGLFITKQTSADREGASTPSCAHCNRTKDLKTCLGCRAVSYCSTECQKADWRSGHKAACKKAQAAAKEAQAAEAPKGE